MVTIAVRPSLYTQLGGRDAIAVILGEFYRRIIDDRRLRAFFTGVDMERQRRHLTAFVGFALGGPNEYQGHSLREAHRGLGITSAQFGAVAGHLQAALLACGVSVEATGAVIGAIAGFEGAIVGR